MKMFSFANILALVVLFVAFAAFALPAAAYSNIGMELSAAKLSGCPGYAMPVDLVISNNDDTTHTYELMLELPFGWKVPDNGFIQPAITLASGESQKITFWINPPAASPGVYNAKVKAKVGVEEAAQDIQVEVLGCHIVSIDAQDAIEICQDSEFQYSFSLANLGKEAEEFEITAAASWLAGKDAELHRESVVIEPGKPKQVSFSVKAPAETGIIKVKAVSKSSYASAEKQTQVNVRKCYDFVAGFEPKEAPACLGGSANFVVSLKNTGTAADVYLIETPSWVKPSQSNVTVLPGEERSVGIFAYPEAKGKTSFTIKITSKGYPKVSKEAEVTVEAKECKGVAVIVSPAEQEVCAGTPVSLKVTVKNTGMAADTYDLEANLGELGDKALEIEQGEIKETTLDIATAGLQGEALVTVVAKSGEVLDQNSARIMLKNCYSADFGVSPEKAEACPGDEINYTIVLKNTGLFADNYTFSLEGKDIGSVGLEPNELRMFATTLKPTGFAEGGHNLTFKAASPYVTKEAVSVVTVKPEKSCYNIEITSDSARSTVEPGTGIALAVNLKNTGQNPETYALSLEGPAWVQLNQNTVTLQPGEEGTVYLYASPGYEVKKSVYQAELTAKSETSESGMTFRIGVGVVPEDEKNVTGNGGIRIPTGALINFGGTTGKVIVLALIVAIILIILIVKFVLFVK